jgi:ligand-binding SRPBCC domain-containing protein
MAYQLQRIQQLQCDVATAWKFFSSPHNLSHITPKEMKFTVLSKIPDEGIYEGMLIDYTVSPLLGIPLRWQTKITQVDEGKSFMDIQERGPYRQWNHFHEFIPTADGVLMKDTVTYDLPLGLLGHVAHALMVRNKLNVIFDYRYKVLDRLFNPRKENL